MTSPQRQQALEKMSEVYAMPFSDDPSDYFGYTADHLFGEIWSREGLSVRDRRLLLIGVMMSQGAADVCELQMQAALKNGELDADGLRECVIFLAHYAGWHNAGRMHPKVARMIDQHESENS